MDDHEEAPSGRVYSLADGPRAVPTDSACCITNGPAVSPDGRFLYPVDTLDRKIWRHEIGTDGAPRSEEHTSELQSLMSISYAVFCLKKKNNKEYNTQTKTNK